jgi:phosphate transport system substrate-binding protein
MNNKAFQKRAALVINALLLLSPLLLLLNCSQPATVETARSGQLTLAVDRQFIDIAGTQRELFTRYYPDAHITITPSSSGKTLKHLLESTARAALISGELEAGEDSLFSTLHHPLRREPVARDAIVCIVNPLNPLNTLSVQGLGSLFSEKEHNGTTPLITADDYRLQSVFAASIGIHKKNLHAQGCISENELIKRVSVDTKAVGLLFRSSLDGARGTGKVQSNVKIISLKQNPDGAQFFQPTQQNIFEGRYPLVTTVYYVYYSGDALAAGFGSWLSSSGQKVFERSSLAPYKGVERTIILK